MSEICVHCESSVKWHGAVTRACPTRAGDDHYPHWHPTNRFTPRPIAAEKREVDPVCLVHGKKKSEHTCLYCCLCFKPLTPDECSFLPNGTKIDVCVECAETEKEQVSATIADLQRKLAEAEKENAELTSEIGRVNQAIAGHYYSEEICVGCDSADKHKPGCVVAVLEERDTLRRKLDALREAATGVLNEIATACRSEAVRKLRAVIDGKEGG